MLRVLLIRHGWLHSPSLCLVRRVEGRLCPYCQRRLRRHRRGWLA